MRDEQGRLLAAREDVHDAARRSGRRPVAGRFEIRY